MKVQKNLFFFAMITVPMYIDFSMYIFIKIELYSPKIYYSNSFWLVSMSMSVYTYIYPYSIDNIEKINISYNNLT